LVSFGFVFGFVLAAALWLWDRLSLKERESARDKGYLLGRAYSLGICRLWNFSELKILKPEGPIQACVFM
jgi:hypothetical protein